ncbi:DNA-dependent protein kinase catalytic subunit-like [Armigeres subalbatus]|uniref:DNA-dependent protein kinase catalytic subunit-like n=1 Tax=Armigeres subalbatus TaxID=124917 RepID=UPI002ED68A44
MATELERILSLLKGCIDAQHAVKGKECILTIGELVLAGDGQSSAESEYYLDILINSPNGVLAFLQRSIKTSGRFQKVNEEIFELLRRLVQKHSVQVRKSVESVVRECVRYVQSSSVSARERELATAVVQDLLVYNCLDEQYDMSHLLGQLLTVFDQRSKLTNRFQQNLFELIGLIAKDFPECVSEAYQRKIVDNMMRVAEGQLLEENYPSLVSLAGALQGLNYYLVNFAPGNEVEEQEHQADLRRRIYLIVKKLSDWDEAVKERQAFRNALVLLERHSALFSPFLYADYVHWQNILTTKWLRSSVDDRKVAIYALHSFHREIARQLVTREDLDASASTANDGTRDARIAVLSYFMKYFKTVLMATGSKPYEIRVAIRGFGSMAAACSCLMTEEYMNELLLLVMQRTEFVYLVEEKSNELLEHLPDFVQALSDIMSHVRELTGVQIVALQNIIIGLIKDFHYLSSSYHELIVSSLMKTFDNLSKLGGGVLENLLEKVILRGIIWSCSHMLVVDVNQGRGPDENSNWKDYITYRNYLPLWKGLLTPGSSVHSNRVSLVKIVYAQLMKTLFLILDKIDLSTQKRTVKDDTGEDQEVFFCDPNIDLSPVKPKDFHIFFNLVDLYQDLLRYNNSVRDYFEEWIPIYFDYMVKKSLKHPLVSGLVKLIDLGMSTANQLQYFQSQQIFSKMSTINLLVYYLELQIAKSRNSTGELQHTCLRFILGAPVMLLDSFLDDSQDLVEILRIALQLGRGMLSLANVALSCVRRLVSEGSPISPENRERVLVHVLPFLDSYLQTRDVALPPPISSRLVKFQRKRSVHMTSSKIEKIKLQHALDASESDLVKFQLKILVFLGDLEPTVCTKMILHAELGETAQQLQDSEKPLVLWDLDSNRNISLQLLSRTGIRPIIKLDTIIARVCTLAVGSSDRKTKVAACELLHALILYTIGIQYQDKMTKLWTKLCNHLLQLATDTDIAVCQMFEPLLFQIIHYLTQPSKIGLKGTEILASCLMESISHPTDTSVRDLAARCIREFLVWTVRQTPVNQRSALSSSSSANLSVMLEKLRTFSLDSNPNRRLGAALAFNNIYRILREDESQIERCWFDLFYVFCMNFVMTEDFDSSTTNLEQVSAAIDHLVRVLVVRKDLFNRESSVRIVPRVFGGSLLKDLILWLFGQCSCRESSYRHKCMEVFLKLATLIDGCRSGADFVGKYLSDQQILDVCDHEATMHGIRNSVNLQFISEKKLPIIVNVYLWLEHFASSLDMYFWLIKNSLLRNAEELLESSNLFTSVAYFLASVSKVSMFELMTTIRPNIVEDSHASIEFRVCTDKIIKFNLLKCTITVRIVDLLCLVLPLSCCRSIPDTFWDSMEVSQFIVDLVFEPQKMGFDFKSCRETIENLPKRVMGLLDKVEMFENLRFKETTYRKLSEKLSDSMKDLSDRIEDLINSETIGLEDSNWAKGMLMMAQRYTIIFKRYFSSRTIEFLEAASNEILHNVFNGLKKKRSDELFLLELTPSVKRFLSSVLLIALHLKSTGTMELLVEFMLNSQKLRMFQQSSRSVILHGEHFVNTFEEVIFEYVIQHFPESLISIFDRLNIDNFPVVLKWVCNCLEFIYQKKRSEISSVKPISDFLLCKWSTICNIASETENKFGSTDLRLIEFMSNLAMVSPFALNDIGRKAVGFENWLLTLISNAQNSLDLKAKAMFLLPALVGESDFDKSTVAEALQKMQNQHFPLRSLEFVANSAERVSFENCLTALLDAMVASRSPVLLKAVIDATAADPEHIAEHKIRNAFEKYMSSQNNNQQCYNLKQIFAKFREETLEPNIRITMLKRYLITALPVCNLETIYTFYKLYIKTINDMIRSNYGQFGSGWEAEHALVNRLGGYQLIELYAAIVPRQYLLTDNCIVAKALYGEDGNIPGNRLITDLTKKAYAARSEVFLTPDSPTAELFRKYQCAAYRALAAIISNTKDDLQLYNVLLFRENSDKNEFIWRKLVNCTDAHMYDSFSQELEEYPKIRDKIVSIQRLSSASTQSSGNRFKYIQMTSVFESSLSQDVTKLDLNYSVVRTTQEMAVRAAEEFDALKQKQATVSLERSKINDQEVMATICAVIQHMHENKITPLVEGINAAPPPWIKFLAASLRDQQQHKNVRLFLAKVIDNCRTWLKPYATTLIPPLMQMIVDECIASQLNTLVTDLIALILEWSDQGYQPASLDEISLATGLVKFVMRNCFHERREVFRLNLELVKRMIEQWKTVVSVPVQLLYDMIGPTQDPESVQNIGGLQLNAIVMANGLVPWTETSKFDFIRAIFRCLDSEKAAVYRPASELLGMCLSNLYPGGEEQEDERYQNEFLAKLIAMRKRQEKKFFDIIYGIHKSFPSIVDSFLAVVTNAIPSTNGAPKKILLEMLLSRIEIFKEQVHRELLSLDLKGMLKDRQYQLLALHLINKSLSLMSNENLENLLENVASLASIDRPEVRDIVYEILIFLQENSLEALSTGSRQKLKRALLAGLSDSEQTIQNRIFDFWTNETRFPTEIDSRFRCVLSDLYDPSKEADYLGYATQILLDSAVKNPESKRRIFQHEYEVDVKLKEYAIDTRWRQRNSFASAPLFVESQQRLFTAGDGSQMERLIKATQFNAEGVLFEPTLDPSLITQPATSFTLPTQHSLMFEINPPVLDRRSRRTTAPQSAPATVKSYDSLRKRILKDKDRSARNQALRAIERYSYETVRKAESHKMKQGEVVLYRRYRIGDFPDLLINSLALLMPLQALCRRDPQLARQVFVAIFSGILDEWEQTEQDPHEAISAINASIQNIFTETKSCDPNFFGALIEVAMMRPKLFDLPAESVATVAVGANMMTMGVLYLESKLHEYDFPDQSISSRSSSVTLEALHWIKLAELNHSLNEYDILGDIFSDKMDSDPRLREAIELESSGNFYKARELYHQMIRDNQTRVAEQNFCYQSYFNCFAQMGMWEDLVPILERQVDGNSEEFWTDEWNLENILPKYVHSNARLNLAGDERGRAFIELLEAWMRVPDRMDYIKSNFGEEISMLQIASGEYSRAKMYSNQVMRQFLEEWSYLDVLSDKIRVQKLLTIRKVSEIYSFSSILNDRMEENQLQKLVSNWKSSFPTASDSPMIWDTLLVYRKFVLNKLETLLETTADDRLHQTDFVKKLTDAVFETELRLLDASFAQNNYRFAKKIMKRLEMVADEQSERGYRWRIAQLKLRRIGEVETGGVSAASFQRLDRIWQRLKAVVQETDLERYRVVKVTGLHELFQMTETLREIVHNNPQLDQGSMAVEFVAHSRQSLQKSIEVLSEEFFEDSTVGSKDMALLADCHFKMAQFCYEQLEREVLGETLDLERQLVNALLCSMQYGSKPARQLFPCLLQLPYLQDGTLHASFIDASSTVPEWMFLRWIPQILSFVDFSQESFLESILTRIATNYPMALYYPAKMNFQRYHARTGSISPFASRFMQLLDIPNLDHFVTELSQVVIPSMKVNKAIIDLRMAHYESNEEYQKLVNDLANEAFPEDSPNLGREHQKLIPLKGEWLKLLELDLNQTEEIHRCLNALKEKITRLIPKQTTLELNNYSPWLAGYHFSQREEMLELPGQYNVDYKPNVCNHVKIVKVCTELELYITLRNPIRIRINGSDGKAYDFLVKYGEDLRQDQRIQQLLGTISNQLALDRQCKEHQLSVRTYEVVPIRADFGIIGWLSNTSSIKRIAVRSMIRFNPDGDVTGAISSEYNRFLLEASGLSGDQLPPLSKLYGKVAAVSTPERIALKFNELRYKIKEDTFKRALFEMAVSAESFYSLRANFAKSLMTMNASCWVLGVGDRNTSNVLIDHSSGKLTGVDFGIAFGAGIRDQGIPEMVPFRLTPQFVNVMEPMRTSGVMHMCMVYTLRCLRDSRKLLKSCLEVFVREPTLDWLEAAQQRFPQYEDKPELRWDPQARINIAIRKLNGANPKVLIAEELRLGQVGCTREILEGYLKLLQVNDPPLESGNLTVEQQVQCLLKTATSGAVLGITYAGWFPWF